MIVFNIQFDLKSRGLVLKNRRIVQASQFHWPIGRLLANRCRSCLPLGEQLDSSHSYYRQYRHWVQCSFYKSAEYQDQSCSILRRRTQVGGRFHANQPPRLFLLSNESFLSLNEAKSNNNGGVFLRMSREWRNLGLSENLPGKQALKCLEEEFKFAQATPVQTASIPLFLSHKVWNLVAECYRLYATETCFEDVVAEACTGSGKTLAFLLPIPFQVGIPNPPDAWKGVW